jgi:signal transduction histidine kinase
MDASSLEAFLDSLHESVLLADGEGKIVYINRAGRVTFQREGEEILGALPGRAIGCLHSEDYGCGESAWCPCGLSEGISEVLDGVESVLKDTLSFPLRRGDTVEVRNFAVNMFPLPGQGSETVCILLHDVTPLIRTRDELRLAQDNLEKRAAQCESLTETILQDIRAPLGRMMESLREGEGGAVSAEVLDDFAYLTLTVENLLLLSQLDPLGLPMSKIVLDPRISVEKTVDGLRATQPDGGPAVEFTPPDGEIATVSADEKLLNMILENLLRNAVSQSPKESPVTVEIESPGMEGVVITIRRGGKSLPEEHLESIFNPDFHLERPGGLGRRNRGLPFCSLAAQAQGGEVRAMNLEGGGVAFQLTLSVRRRTTGEQEEG